jgi:hypothetical protein
MEIYFFTISGVIETLFSIFLFSDRETIFIDTLNTIIEILPLEPKLE